MGSAIVSNSILLVLLAGASSYNGGSNSVSIQNHPYFASMENNGRYLCPATIIDDKFVMTTFSCVQGIDVKTLGVRMGTSKQGYKGAYYRVADVISYKFSPLVSSSKNDIAMIKLPIFVSFTPEVMWANPNSDGLYEYQQGYLVGWKDTQERGSSLTSAKAYVLPSSNCSQMYAGVMNISDNMYCLMPSDPANPLLFVDMGAPFYRNEQYYGVVTRPLTPGDPDLPVVVTSVASMTGFIITTLCDLKEVFSTSLQSVADTL